MDLSVKKKCPYDIESLLGTETNNVTVTTSPHDVTDGHDGEKEETGKSIEIKTIIIIIMWMLRSLCTYS